MFWPCLPAVCPPPRVPRLSPRHERWVAVRGFGVRLLLPSTDATAASVWWNFATLVGFRCMRTVRAHLWASSTAKTACGQITCRRADNLKQWAGMKYLSVKFIKLIYCKCQVIMVRTQYFVIYVLFMERININIVLYVLITSTKWYLSILSMKMYLCWDE